MFSKVSIIDDSSMADEFTFAGIWEQASLCQSHMAAKRSAVPVFPLAAPIRPRTPQSK